MGENFFYDREYHIKYYQNNRDKIKAYYDDNKEHIIQKSKEYIVNHRQASRKYRMTYYEKNKDKQKAYYQQKRKNEKNIKINQGTFTLTFD